MYIANPVRLPITTDMLSQPNLVMHHKDHTVFSRTAWLLSIDLSRQEFFFSKRVGELLSASWWSGTQTDYACKLKQFND